MKTVLKPAANAAWQILEGEAVLVDLISGRSVGLNNVGTHIWAVLNGRDEDEITAEVVRKYRIDADAARQDVTEFVALLESYKLVARTERSRT
jgi:hypothetical protein